MHIALHWPCDPPACRGNSPHSCEMRCLSNPFDLEDGSVLRHGALEAVLLYMCTGAIRAHLRHGSQSP